MSNISRAFRRPSSADTTKTCGCAACLYSTRVNSETSTNADVTMPDAPVLSEPNVERFPAYAKVVSEELKGALRVTTTPPSYSVDNICSAIKYDPRTSPRTAATSRMYEEILSYFDEDLDMVPHHPEMVEDCFDIIYDAISDFEITKLSAADLAINPDLEEKWGSWISIVKRVVPKSSMLLSFMEPHRDEILNGAGGSKSMADLLMYHAMQTSKYEDTLEALLIKDGTVGVLRTNNALVPILIQHRIQALLELSIRSHEVDDWPLHQMEVCNGWFRENDEALSCIPDIREGLEIRWIEELWMQWEESLKYGFDEVLAPIWEPDLLSVMMKVFPREGQYPEEEEFSYYWFEVENELDVYDDDIEVVEIDGKRYKKPEGGDGDILSHITLEYLPTDKKEEAMSIRRLLSGILQVKLHVESWKLYGKTKVLEKLEWFEQEILRSNLDAETAGELMHWVQLIRTTRKSLRD